MKKIGIYAAAVLMTAAVLFTACGKPAAPETTPAPETTAAPASAAAETAAKETEPESTEAPEEEILGVIVDGAMHTVMVQTEQGEMMEIRRQMDDGKDPDLSGLKDGILIGHGVRITGRPEEDGTFRVLKLEDADIACGDPDAMETAVNVFFSFRAKNRETFTDLVSFPLTAGKEEITSEDELAERIADDVLFSDALVSAVTGADLTRIAPEDGEMALPGREGPHVIISLTDDGWAVTEIDP